jgi:hypothetical protein
LLSAFIWHVEDYRCNRQNDSGKIKDAMSKSKYDNAADLRIYATHAHTAAAAAHYRGDHEAVEELSSGLRTIRWQLLRKRLRSQSKFTPL